MLDFYQRIRELEPESRNVAMTILDGPYAGEKALVSDGKVVWCTDEQDRKSTRLNSSHP